MSFTLAFSILQGTDPQSFTLVDDSTGSDVTVTQRRIILSLSDGSTLVPTGTTTSYINFPFSEGSSKELAVLNIDYAISITLQYLDVGGTVVDYLPQSYCFTGNDELFMYGLVQNISATPSILQDTNYMNNCYQLDMFVSFASKAVTTGNDIAGAQFLLDLAQNMIDNQNLFF